jgi:threonine synthase
LLAAIRATGGGAVAVTEPEIVDALREISAKGVYIEPTSAVAVAAAKRLVRSGSVANGERLVAVLSGSGLKATETIRQLVAPA